MLRQASVLTRRVFNAAQFSRLGASATAQNGSRYQLARAFADEAAAKDAKATESASSSDDEPAKEETEENSCEKQLKEAQEKIEDLEGEVKKQKRHVLETLAEMENLRKMKDRQIEDIRKFAAGDFAKHLLDVSDNFRRAADAVKHVDMEQNKDLKLFYDGVMATERELLHAFGHIGVKKMDPVGHPFDPNYHEALFEIPEQEKDGIVMQVMRDGYQIHERCLRAAQVGVSKAAKKIE
eukprot:TRINITY_DN190_c0_g1_i1.p1 TRINITY_DN190_c0_g1~~TRINITY_DN190_c0_g1_i1.p1  ORF type:complete len:238 (-),score=88.43 TRINITY_DN190_c0_g1_i1:800-1513(-)